MKTVALLAASLVLFSTSSAFAGNVRASISGGNLYVYGDESSNNIIIDSTGPGSIRVSGVNSGSETTTVNSRSTPANFRSWTGGVFVYLYGGNDTLTLLNGDANGAVHIDLGSGNDDVMLGETLNATMTNVISGASVASPLTLRSTLFVIGAAGADLVAIDNSQVLGRTTIDLGSQADEFYAADVSFRDSLVIIPADGDDFVDVFSCDVGLDLILDDSVGALQMQIEDVQVGRNTFIYGTPSNDRIVVKGISVNNLFQIFSEAGDDFVSVGGQAKTLEIFAGSNSDRVALSAMTSLTTRVYLDAGTDSLRIEDSDIQTLNAFGGADNDRFVILSSVVDVARIYGDGGTDTFGRSASSIGKLYLYSIETP